MKSPVRVTIALDEETEKLFERLKSETRLSQSELLRRALRFYSENKEAIDSTKAKKLKTYLEMLSEGEHIILDVDHWHLFLKLLDCLPEDERERFWEAHRAIARSHAEQLAGKVKSVRDLLERLEACNFYKLGRVSEEEFTLVMGSEANKRFIKEFIEIVAQGIGFKVEMKEDLLKLRLRISHKPS